MNDALRDEYARLLSHVGAVPRSSAVADSKRLMQHVVEAYDHGEVAALGEYGRRLLDSLRSNPALSAAMDAQRAAAFPFIDETGKVGRYLAMVQQVLDQRGITLDREILFGEFPTHQFNACVLITPSGLLCLINTGLLDLIYHVCVASCYCVFGVAEEDAADARHANKMSADDAAILAVIRMIVAYIRGEPHRHVVPRGFKLDAEALYTATVTCYAIRVFVLAHEIGHVVLGHADADRSRPLSSVADEVGSVSRNQDNEFAADAFAQELLLSIDRHRYFPEPIAAGGIGFLMVHAMILEVVAKINGQPIDRTQSSESHPSTWVRLRRLNESLVEHYSNTTYGSRADLANCVVLQRVLRRIERANIGFSGPNIQVILNP